MGTWRRGFMTIRRRSTLGVRISTFLSSARVCPEIGAACHLVRKRPGTTFAILEARNAIGGTWDLFRYPGIRSNSDMSTFGYAFRPWNDSTAIADGPSILRYLAETAKAYGVDRHIRFGLKVVRASWSSKDARWALDVDGPDGEKLEFSCSFLFLCTGYYEYAEGYTPAWPGTERFGGHIVHPQKWPEDLRYDGKRVLVIGSGATAVTIVPSMAAKAAHIVMLQRSPTYVVARPTEEAIAEQLKQWLPARAAHALTRWKNILLQMYLYRLSRRKPARRGRNSSSLRRGSLAQSSTPRSVSTPDTILGTSGCASPQTGTCSPPCAQARPSILNGEIETFTETGLRLTSGQEIEADLIVTATGLKVRLMGGVGYRSRRRANRYREHDRLQGRDVQRHPEPGVHLRLYERLLDAQVRSDRRVCLPAAQPYGSPRIRDLYPPPRRCSDCGDEPTLPLTSGYIERAKHLLFKQGTKKPWRVNQNYALDVMAFRFGAIEDGALQFKRRGSISRAA